MIGEPSAPHPPNNVEERHEAGEQRGEDAPSHGFGRRRRAVPGDQQQEDRGGGRRRQNLGREPGEPRVGLQRLRPRLRLTQLPQRLAVHRNRRRGPPPLGGWVNAIAPPRADILSLHPPFVYVLCCIWHHSRVQRTIRLRLLPTVEQAGALTETARLFTLAFNAVAAHGWQHGEKNGVTLHHATYRRLKTEYPSLVSDLHIQARVKATEAVKSALALQKHGRTVSAPRSLACPPHYNVHTMRLDWSAGTVRLSTTSGRQSIPFRLPAYAQRYAGCEEDTADLICRDGVWWLHAVVTVPSPEIVPTDDVVGVDLGLAQPAVTSTGRFLGKKAWRAIEARRFKHRRALQSKGTK